MNAHGVLDSRWITVDLGRIVRLPERLRRLWPRDLLPETGTGETGAGAGAGPRSTASAAAASAGITLTTPTGTELAGLPAEVVRPRDLDVLSAWLAGFAAELDLARSRMTLVVGAERSAVHLELAIAEQTCLAMLALRGADNADFAGFEFLRRLAPDEVAAVGEDLADLVPGDCVLTLTSLGAGTGGEPARAGMEFLHRQAGTWSRPLLDRGEAGMLIAQTEEMPDGAVRMVIASMLTRLHFAQAGTP